MKKVWERCKRIAQKLGNFQAKLLLSILYFTVVVPFALGVKFFSDPLGLKKTLSSYWSNRKQAKIGIKEASREF